MPSASERSGRTSTGTWYVEPPTRRLFTSTRGRTFESARSHTFSGSSLARSATMSRAPYTMPSATAFLPSRMTTFTNLVMRRRTSDGASVNLGSGRTLRLGTSPLRGMAVPGLLRALRAVLRARLLAVLHARGVERAADDVVPDAGEILDAAAADQHDRVLLQVVTLARNVRGDLHAVGEPHARNLAE